MAITLGVLLRSCLLLSIVAGSVVLVSAPGPQFTDRDKAFYADPNLVDFVRPGLVIKIASAEVADDGTIRARVRLTDPRGLPLDRLGVTTPGLVNLSFVAANIPKGETDYVAYTTRTQNSPITGRSAVQASADTGGAFEQVGDGEYVYTFATKAPAGFQRNATHSIGVYGSRNLAEFDLGTNFDDDVFTFVPDGSQVAEVHDIVRTQTCNKCHDPLGAHGGARRSVELCVLCHTPQTVDPDTGNTVDLPVMIHKIHMGAQLPSVQAGRPYRIVGFNQTVVDFSGVVFPAGIRNCQFCHEPGPAQANAWLRPNMAACGACHDNVNFATGEHHADLPQVSNNQCPTCHFPQGELEFDLSVIGAHTIERFSRNLPGVVFDILAVDGAAGRAPTVTFSIKDKAGNPIQPSQMTRVALVLAGPTSDFSSAVTEDVGRAQGSQDGRYVWTFQQSIPAGARGAWAVGIEGYRNATLLPGTRQERTVRDAGQNKVFYFAVDSSRVEPRRAVVAQANCNSCHFALDAHGSNRNQVEHCVLCHNPAATDVARRPADDQPPQTVDFRTLIHKIHRGEELTREYVVFGFGPSRHDFGEVHFPGDLRNCAKCHANGSEQLPLRSNLLSVSNPRGLINPTPPETAACIACHDTAPAASHARVNTSDIGESCAVCHGRTSEFSVNRVHAR